MPFIKYVSKKFNPKSEQTIETANKIIEEYEGQGYELTLRQLYYQFVARDLIENTERSYKNLGSLINDARLAGLIDWNAIQDRTRNLQGNIHYDSPAHRIDNCVRDYAIDKWKNQEYRVEVWVEKDALVGILEGVCGELDVDFFSCRGYTSQSEMWVAAQRLRRYERNGQETIIIHLGDHDPSGKDMSRDVQDRLRLFGSSVTVERIALNMDQVRKYKPPPNPAKVTDSRAGGYIREFGNKSWELDALEPSVLSEMIERNVLSYRDEDIWQENSDREETEKAVLQKIAEDLEKKKRKK